MPQPESLIAKLIPGDLENQIPAAVQKVLPGGFKNRLVQFALGLLVTFGLSFVVRNMLARRENRRRALAPAPIASALPPPIPAEPRRPAAVGPAMTTADPAAGGDPLLAQPHVCLSGVIDQAMYASFRDQLAAAPREGTLVVALSTLGGDPDVARLMGDDIRLLREFQGREILFLGKVAVYSPGATFMASFAADKRFLTKGTRIMIHERILSGTIDLSGPLRSCVAGLKANLNEIEHAIRIEEQSFRELVTGSRISLDEVRQRAPANWYIEAEEARDLGLVLDVI